MLLAHRVSEDRKRRTDKALKTWVSVLFFTVFLGVWSNAQAAANPARPLEKVVISDVIYSSECVGSTSDYTNQGNRSVPLRQQLNARFPREILSSQTMGLEDLDDYKVVEQWNPQNYDVRQLKMIQGVLDRFNIKYLIRLTISCDPESHRPITMSASMTGLDEIDRILKCGTSTSAKGKQGRICNANNQVFKAIRYSTVEIDQEKPVAENFGTVLIHLLHVPELRFGAKRTTVDPSEFVSLPFLISINDGTEKAYNGPESGPRKYHVEQDVVQIPKDVARKVCAEPEDYWKKLRCVHGDAEENASCDAADDIEFEARSLIHRRTKLSALQTKGGERIEFRVAGYPTTYLIRAQAVAMENDGTSNVDLPIRSLPTYQCIDVRWREHHLSLTIGFGVGNDFKTLTNQDNAIYPAARLMDGSFQLALGYLRPIDTSVDKFPYLPGVRYGVGLGYSWLAGRYPCPTVELSSCGPQGFFTLRDTTSQVLDLRFMGEGNLYTWKWLSLSFLVDLSLGLEFLKTTSEFEGDGFYGMFGSALGLGASVLLANSESIFGTSTFAVQWQMRLRFPSASVPKAGYVDAPGVPDGTDIVWFVYRQNIGF